MLRRVALVRTDVSEECRDFIIRVTRVGELGTTLAVTINRRKLLVTANVVPSPPILVTMIMEAPSSSETSLCISSQRELVVSYGYVPSLLILVTLMMEALSSSETPHSVTS
jgi:hypothetical protein